MKEHESTFLKIKMNYCNNKELFKNAPVKPSEGAAETLAAASGSRYLRIDSTYGAARAYKGSCFRNKGHSVCSLNL